MKYFNPLHTGKLRNDPCPCGSGKKIKKCHGIDSTVNSQELDLIKDMINNFNKRYKEAFEKNMTKELEKLSIGDLSEQPKEETTTDHI